AEVALVKIEQANRLKLQLLLQNQKETLKTQGKQQRESLAEAHRARLALEATAGVTRKLKKIEQMQTQTKANEKELGNIVNQKRKNL
ncbi:unnamed protein product, partial [Amoebophrya sp. A25]